MNCIWFNFVTQYRQFCWRRLICFLSFQHFALSKYTKQIEKSLLVILAAFFPTSTLRRFTLNQFFFPCIADKSIPYQRKEAKESEWISLSVYYSNTFQAFRFYIFPCKWISSFGIYLISKQIAHQKFNEIFVHTIDMKRIHSIFWRQVLVKTIRKMMFSTNMPIWIFKSTILSGMRLERSHMV